MRRTASEILTDLELRVASLELEQRIAELEEDLLDSDDLLAEDLLAEELMAIKHLSPSHARAISKGQKKSWRGTQTSRIKSMNKSRKKHDSGRTKRRTQRKKYKKH